MTQGEVCWSIGTGRNGGWMVVGEECAHFSRCCRGAQFGVKHNYSSGHNGFLQRHGDFLPRGRYEAIRRNIKVIPSSLEVES